MLRSMMSEAVKSSLNVGIYRHFKGGYYIVKDIAVDEESGDVLIVYQSLQDGQTWVRPSVVFQSRVPEGKENPTGQEFRFERVTNFDNQLSMVPTHVLLDELGRRNDCPVVLSGKVWREEYLTGYFEDRYVDRDTSYEDFNVDLVHDSFEDAVSRVEKLQNPQMKVLKRVFVHQDF